MGNINKVIPTIIDSIDKLHFVLSLRYTI